MYSIALLVSDCVRGCLIASEGNKLVVSDLSNIEGRVTAWLAGEEWKINAFKAYDRGEGADIYVQSYASAFAIAVGDVTKAQRQIGKVMELAFGFQGSVGAFNRMGEVYGVKLSEDEVLVLVRAWRKAHSRINCFWYDLENAAKRAIRNPGAGYEVRNLRLDVRDGYLRVRLPSGRYLCYADPSIDGDTGQILYKGINQYTRKWETLETYGGKLTENVVQATARDVFMHGFKLAEQHGYEVVLRVHDELVCDVPDTDEFTAVGLSALMSVSPPWAVGLPLTAAGHEMYRYQKMD